MSEIDFWPFLVPFFSKGWYFLKSPYLSISSHSVKKIPVVYKINDITGTEWWSMVMNYISHSVYLLSKSSLDHACSLMLETQKNDITYKNTQMLFCNFCYARCWGVTVSHFHLGHKDAAKQVWCLKFITTTRVCTNIKLGWKWLTFLHPPSPESGSLPSQLSGSRIIQVDLAPNTQS